MQFINNGSYTIKISILTVVAASIVLVAGCTDTKQIKRDVAKQINCATAEGDLRVLQSEKAHVGKQVLSGVTAITPAGAVLGIVTGTEKGKLQVATGHYNRLLDDKIAEIKTVCRL